MATSRSIDSPLWIFTRIFEGYGNRATTFQAMLDAEGITRADLSRRLGCSRAWVSKVLNREERL